MTPRKISEYLISHLVCPRDHSLLTQFDSSLVCTFGHRYPIVEGIPVMLLADEKETIGIAKHSLSVASRYSEDLTSDDPWFTTTLGISENEKDGIIELSKKSNHYLVDPVVQFLVGATNGILYKDVIGKLDCYPIPELRLPVGAGRYLLDIGCSWGRWSVAAAKLGYYPIGIDPSLGAVLAARRVFNQLGLEGDFIVADARFMPFANGSIDTVFSYSVLQHFSEEDFTLSLKEVARVLNADGISLIQMPNRFGLRCLYQQARRGFRKPENFEVRYRSPSTLLNLFNSSIGQSELSIDCFFSIGLQAADINIIPKKYRSLIYLSETLRKLGTNFYSLNYIADSLYITSTKS